MADNDITLKQLKNERQRLEDYLTFGKEHLPVIPFEDLIRKRVAEVDANIRDIFRESTIAYYERYKDLYTSYGANLEKDNVSLNDMEEANNSKKSKFKSYLNFIINSNNDMAMEYFCSIRFSPMLKNTLLCKIETSDDVVSAEDDMVEQLDILSKTGEVSKYLLVEYDLNVKNNLNSESNTILTESFYLTEDDIKNIFDEFGIEPVINFEYLSNNVGTVCLEGNKDGFRNLNESLLSNPVKERK